MLVLPKSFIRYNEEDNHIVSNRVIPMSYINIRKLFSRSAVHQNAVDETISFNLAGFEKLDFDDRSERFQSLVPISN